MTLDPPLKRDVPRKNRCRSEPALALALILCGCYLFGAFVPLSLGSDLSFQIKSTRQFLNGDTSWPNFVSIPNPDDLSSDTSIWIAWWPPGGALAFLPALALFGDSHWALRASFGALMGLGGIGWLRVMRAIGLDRRTQGLALVPIGLYSFTIGGASGHPQADALAFAIMPWLVARVVGLWTGTTPFDNRRTSHLGLVLGLGSMYWVKYSGFVGALGSIVAVCWLKVRAARGTRLVELAAFGAALAAPVLLLTALNLFNAGTINTVTQEANNNYFRGTTPSRTLLALAGSPGNSFLHAHTLNQHISHFLRLSGRSTSELTGLDPSLLYAVLGLPASVGLAWLLAGARTTLGPALLSLTTLIIVVPLITLALLSLFVGYDFASDVGRYSASFMPLPTAIALHRASVLWRTCRSRSCKAWLTLFGVYLALPSAFVLADVVSNRFLPSISSATPTNPTWRSIVSSDQGRLLEICNRAPSRPTVTFLALVDGSGTSFVPWADCDGRSAPMNFFSGPLGAPLENRYSLLGTEVFRTLRPVRLILLVSSPLDEAHMGTVLRQRFPQASGWLRHTPAPETYQVWSTDLLP